MYALKARDKLHKQEKEEYEARHSPRQARPKRTSGGSGGKSPKVDSKAGPVTLNREAKYVGSYSIDVAGGWKSDFGKTVKQQLSRVNLKDPSHMLMAVSLRINMEGVKVLTPDGKEVIMAHAVKRILYCHTDSKKHLFAFVARNAQGGSDDGVFTHIFLTEKKDQANELNQIVSKAFKVHFASKTIARQRKLIVQQHPQKQRRSPSPSPRSISPVPPYNPNAPQTQPSQATPPYNPGVPHSQPSQAPPQAAPPYNPAVQPSHGGNHRRSRELQVPNGGVGGGGGGGRKRRSQVVQECGVLEQEMAAIQHRLQEIQQQMRELAGIEDAIVELTMQSSSLQARLEEKRRQQQTLQFQLQDLALQEQPMASGGGAPTALLAPPLYPGLPADDPLPDFSNLSLEEADWFHEGIPREIAAEVLSQQADGAFMVRQSSSSPGCYALSMKAPNGVINYLIENVPGGFRLQGSSVLHSSVVELVNALAVNRESLPCALKLNSGNPAYLHGDNGDGDSDEDEEYTRAVQYRLLS